MAKVKLEEPPVMANFPPEEKAKKTKEQERKVEREREREIDGRTIVFPFYKSYLMISYKNVRERKKKKKNL